MIGVRGDNVLCRGGLPGVYRTERTDSRTQHYSLSEGYGALSLFTISIRSVACDGPGPVYPPVSVSEVTMYCVEAGSEAAAGSQVPGQKGLG